MTLEELKTSVQGLQIEAIYGYFPEAQEPPYIVYQADTAQVIHADGVVVYLCANVSLTLVTATRDLSKEAAITAMLTTNGVSFDEPDFEFDETQKIHKTTYYFQTEN